jgi:hypothetical protein
MATDRLPIQISLEFNLQIFAWFHIGSTQLGKVLLHMGVVAAS